MTDVVLGLQAQINGLRAEAERLRAENERLCDENGPLIAVCREFIERWPTERGIDDTIQRARAILLDHDLRNPEQQSVNRAVGATR